MDLTAYESVECEKNIPANIFITSINKSSFHWHFEYELILVLKGSIQINTSPNVTILKTNDIILINSKTVHEIKKTAEGNICLFVQIAHSLFQDWEDKQRSYHFYLNSAGEGIYVNDKINHFINIAARIGLEYHKVGINGSRRMKALIFTLAADCFEYLPFIIQQHSKGSSQKKISEKLMQIIDYIQDNYKKPTVIDDVANEFGMSNKTLYRFLKTNSGLTIRDLVINCRIESAKSMLKYSDKNLQYIAEECGFGSDMTFFRSFKKNVGYTPSEYRKNGQSIEKNPSIKGYMKFSKKESYELLEKIYKETM